MPNFLIIEDNPVDAKLFEDILHTSYPGAGVFTARTGRLGLSILQDQRIDLLILDVYLEDQQCLEILQKIRSRTKTLPILLTSSFENDRDRALGLKLGVTDFIHKPVHAEEVKARVAVQLRLLKVIADAQAAERRTTERILQLNRDLESRNARLAELSILKDEFVRKVSHDLRTPMTIVRESISQIADGVMGAIPAAQQDYLHNALQELDHLAAMIDDLLDAASIEQGRLRIEKHNTDIAVLVREVVDHFQIRARGLRLSLLADVPEGEMMIPADPGRIRQVLQNLIGNALKFTAHGEIRVGAVMAGSGVKCFVRDTGCGIAAEDIPKLFKKFEQVGGKPDAGGTGLGLVIAKELVELHGGRMSVESSEGQGACFTFFLPGKT